MARAVYDEALAAFDVAEADVANVRASLSKTELELSYTRIATPISGRIGQPFFTTGNLVGADSGPIARIVRVDPVRVTFSVAEGAFTTLRQQLFVGGGAASGGLRLTLTLPNGTAYGPEGALEFVAPEIDPRTGIVAVRTVFPNPEGLLVPGQFVKVNAGGFISRPRFASVLAIVPCIGGVLALFGLPVPQYPDITPPSISVSAFYPGANAEVISKVVGDPLESAINGVDDMTYMSSNNSDSGAYSLTVTFAVGTDPDLAQINVQNRAQLAMAQLPAAVS